MSPPLDTRPDSCHLVSVQVCSPTLSGRIHEHVHGGFGRTQRYPPKDIVVHLPPVEEPVERGWKTNEVIAIGFPDVRTQEHLKRAKDKPPSRGQVLSRRQQPEYSLPISKCDWCHQSPLHERG